MPRKLDGSFIQTGSITTTQLSSAVTTQISAGGGPKVKSLIYPGNDTAANTVGGQTLYLTGSGFAANAQVLVNGAAVPSQSFISAGNISFTTPALSTGTYPVYLINPEDGGTAILYPGLLVSGEPTWVTSAGSLSSSQDEASAWSFSLSTSGDTPITYALAAGNTLPSGITLAANGLISGTLSSPSGNATTYTFSVVASDAQNQDSTRQFSVTTSTGEGVLFANNVLLIHADGTNNQNNHTFLDSSNNNFTITRYGNATQGSFSPFSQTGWSNYFDGTGDYLTLSNSISLSGNFTIEGWFNLGSAQSNYRMLTGQSVASSGTYASITSGGIEVQFGGSSSTISTCTFSFTTNIWYHIAIVRSGSTVSIYINGNSQSVTQSTQSGTFVTQYVGVGYSSSYPFHGYISNFRILSGTAAYTTNFTPPTAALTAVSNTTLLTCQSNGFETKRQEYAIINAKIYSVYNGGTRSNNYTVQYSEDNVAWTNAFSGVMQSNACGIFTGTGGGGNYGSHKYWRYVVGSGIEQHHPRVSRIILSSATTDYDVVVFTSDNCADSGTIPTNGATYTLSGDLALTRNGDVSVQPFSPFAPTAAYTTANVGGSAYFDGTGDYLTVADNAAFDLGSGDFTLECWAYTNSFNSQYNVLACQWNTNTGWIFRITASLIGLYANIGGTQNYTASVTNTTGTWDHFAITRTSSTLTFWKNGTSVGTASISGTINNSSDSLVIGVLGDLNGTTTHTGYISGLRIVKGNAIYTSNTVAPTSPPTNIANTSLLCNFTNAGIFDQTAKAVMETVGDAKVSTAQYKYGTASMVFDGTGDGVRVFSSTNISPQLKLGSANFTIEAWVYFNSVSTRGAIFNSGWGTGSYATDGGFTLDIAGVNSGELALAVGTMASGSFWAVGGSFATNTWYHIAMVRNGTNVTVYKDGVSAFSGTLTSASTLVGNMGFFTAGLYDNNTLGFNGYMDDLRITKGYARYTSNFTAPSSAFKDK